MEIEQRNFDFELRAQADPGEEPVIEGVAVVYNQWSEDLGGFREMVEPGFFDDVLKGDVRALWNHNTDLVLGRTKAGTLALEDTERGLGIRIKPPDTQIGRDAMITIGRRDVTQMSFGFEVKPGGDQWTRDKDGTVRRTLKRGGAKKLFDVSPVTFPAYPQTSVSTRSQLEAFTQASQAAEAEASERATAQARNANRKRKLQILEIQ